MIAGLVQSQEPVQVVGIGMAVVMDLSNAARVARIDSFDLDIDAGTVEFDTARAVMSSPVGLVGIVGRELHNHTLGIVDYVEVVESSGSDTAALDTGRTTEVDIVMSAGTGRFEDIDQSAHTAQSADTEHFGRIGRFEDIGRFAAIENSPMRSTFCRRLRRQLPNGLPLTHCVEPKLKAGFRFARATMEIAKEIFLRTKPGGGFGTSAR